jgi:hypothetical protein
MSDDRALLLVMTYATVIWADVGIRVRRDENQEC